MDGPLKYRPKGVEKGVVRFESLSKTTKPMWNQTWKECSLLLCFFVVDRMYTKETIDPEVQKGCCLFLIFFSEFTGPIGPKVGRNVH